MPRPPGLQPQFMFCTFTSVLAAATARQSVSSPTVRVGGPPPPGPCMPAGGGWRANDAVADASRVPTKASVKTEAPPDAASAPLTILEASVGLRAPISPPTTKPTDGGRAAAPQHLLFLQSERAVDARLTAALGEFACPEELRSTRISDSNAVESDRFSVSNGCADWQRACASFARTNSSLLEVGQGELKRADQVRTRHPATAERRFSLESEEPPGCWAASGKAQASLPIPARLSETEAVPMPLPVPPKTEVAEDQRSETSLEELARPAEVCATQIADSKTVESTDLFSISSDLAGSRPRCASCICADSFTLEVEQGEEEGANQAEIFTAEADTACSSPWPLLMGAPV